MARGLKKHLKRLNAARQWMLDKLGGAFAPKPSSGPAILMQRHVILDEKVRTDKTYPSGFMDVFSIPINFRLLYDTTRRFGLLRSKDEEAKLYMVYMRAKQYVDPDRVTALYLEMLSSVLGSKGAAQDSLVYSYTHGFFGFAAKLTDSQAKQMAGLPPVLSVDLSRQVRAPVMRSIF